MDTSQENTTAAVSQILDEISKLNPKEKEELYDHLREELVDVAELERRINSYRGIGRGVWEMDAQEYINELRNDDRI